MNVQRILNFIDGEFVAGKGGEFADHFPTTGEVIA